MSNSKIAMVVAILSETVLGTAYLAYSAYLLSFEDLKYTIARLLLFGYVFISIGSFSAVVKSAFDTGVDKQHP